MISINSIDSFVSKNRSFNKTTNQNNSQFQLETKSKKNHQLSTFSLDYGLNNKPNNVFAKKVDLKFSAQSAINQYHTNKNYEMVEKTKMLFGLSVYA